MITYGLVLEDGGEVANDIDHSEDEAILRAHCEIGSMSVAGHWCLGRDIGEKLVHRRRRADLRRSGIDCEHEDENNGEKDASMCAASTR